MKSDVHKVKRIRESEILETTLKKQNQIESSLLIAEDPHMEATTSDHVASDNKDKDVQIAYF